MPKRLKPEQLTVSFQGVSPAAPVIGRRYTLLRSDDTGALRLTIGAGGGEGPVLDEVLAEWQRVDGQPALTAAVQVAVPRTRRAFARVRDRIFRRDLPLVFEAVRYGDRALFAAHPALDRAPIVVRFRSIYPELNRTEDWGTPGNYK